MPPESHSTAPAEQLDTLCDAILQRLRFVREAQTLVQLADAHNETVTITEAACERLLRAGLVESGTVPQKHGDAPIWYARGYWAPEISTGPLTDTHGPVAGDAEAWSPVRPWRAGPQASVAPRRCIGIHNNPGLLTDIAEAAAVNLCVRQDLERQGASADVLAALTAAATALSGLLLADLRKRQVLA